MNSNFNQQFQQQQQRHQQRQREMGYAWQQQKRQQQGKGEQIWQTHDQPGKIEPTPRKRRGFFYPIKWLAMFIVYLIMPGAFIVVGASMLGTEVWGYDDVLGLIVGVMFALVAAYWLTNKVLNQRA